MERPTEARQLTLFPYLDANPFDSEFCSGSGYHECECYEEGRARVGVYCEPITQPGPYLREVLFLCESCRNRFQANGEIRIVRADACK